MKSTPVILRNSSTQIDMRTRECPTPSGIGNGYIITRPPYEPGDYITYACSAGFFMTGTPSLKCTASFTWLGSPPHCDPIDLAPKFFNNKTETTQVPLWLLMAFSSLFAVFVLTATLLLLCHCCINKGFCALPTFRSKIHHSQWPLPGVEKSDEEQETQDIREQPQKYTGPKCNKTVPSVEQKKMFQVANNQQSSNYSHGNYRNILNETMVGNSCFGTSLPVIYAIPMNSNSNQVKTINTSNQNKTLPAELNSGARQKFQLAPSVSNQEIYSLIPNESIIYVESDSCVYSDRQVAQRIKQMSNNVPVKQQSTFNETCRGQRRSFQAAKLLGQWLPHSRPVRNINTSTK